MKKIIVITIIFSFCLLLTGCPPSPPDYVITSFDVFRLDIENLNYYHESELKNSSELYDKYAICINSVEEVIQIHNNDSDIMNYFKQYTDYYFERNTLVLIPFYSTNEYDYHSCYLDDGNYVEKRKRINVRRQKLLVPEEQITEDKYVVFLSVENNNDKKIYELACGFSGTEEKINSISEFSDVLNNKLLNKVSYELVTESKKEQLSLAKIENMTLEERNESIKQITIKKPIFNEGTKITGAYISKNAYELIDDLDTINGQECEDFFKYTYYKNATLQGIEFNLAKVNEYYKKQQKENFKGTKITFDDIIWYDFNTYDLPKTIGDYYLIGTFAPYYIEIKDLNNKVVYNGILMNEFKLDYVRGAKNSYGNPIDYVLKSQAGTVSEYNALQNIGFISHASSISSTSYLTYVEDFKFNEEIYLLNELYELLDRNSFSAYFEEGNNRIVNYIVVDGYLIWNKNDINNYIRSSVGKVKYRKHGHYQNYDDKYYYVNVNYIKIDDIVKLIKDEIIKK